MALNARELREILDVVGQADVEFLQIEGSDYKITASKNGMLLGGPPEVATSPEQPHAPQLPAEQATVPTDPEPAPGTVLGTPEGTTALPDGCVAIPAPVLGVFYRRPEPGAAPFVEVGSHVDTGTTVALLEVMKMFNAVTSPVAGVIESILADEEQPVEYGQALFAVRVAR